MLFDMKTRHLFAIVLLVIAGVTSCVKDEIFQGPPVVTDLTITPQAPGENEAVTVSVKVTDMNGVARVTLKYRVESGSWQSVSMALANEKYSGQIPGQAGGTLVSYYVEAENESGQLAYAPGGAPETVAAYTVGAPSIVMNEIYSRGTPDNPDWIEIYNNSANPVDVSGYSVYDSGGQSGAKPKKTFPAGTVIPAFGFFVIVTDDADPSGFGMSSGGEEVWFENAAGNVIDNVIFPAFAETQSYGRIPDGSGAWAILDNITKGAPNDNNPPAPMIKINEVYSRGVDAEPDWVEIYNAGTSSVNIGGYKIYDSGGQSGSKPKMEIPAGTSLAAGAFLVITVDDTSAAGFGLSSGGEQVWLEDAAGTVIDDVTFPALDAFTSYGRFPDGSGSFTVLYHLTKGAANSNAAAAPNVKINEVFSRGADPEFDWVEVFNASSVQADLSGYKIYDSGGQSGSKPKMEFPSGTILGPGDFFVIVVDDTSAAGFGLSSGGEQVWLEDATGAVIDDVTFPTMDVTQSYGRLPDGSANLVVFTQITKGTSNNDATTLKKK
jgi:hypothetical protein